MEQTLQAILQHQQDSQERMSQQFAAALQAQATSQNQSASQLGDALRLQQQQNTQQAQQVQTQLEALAGGLREIASRTTMTSQTPGAASQPVAQRLDAGDSDAVRSIVHPGILEKCPSHSGDEANFPQWRFKFDQDTGAVTPFIGRTRG